MRLHKLVVLEYKCISVYKHSLKFSQSEERMRDHKDVLCAKK